MKNDHSVETKKRKPSESCQKFEKNECTCQFDLHFQIEIFLLSELICPKQQIVHHSREFCNCNILLCLFSFSYLEIKDREIESYSEKIERVVTILKR